MKNIFSRWLLLVLLAVAFTGCDLSIDEEVSPPEEQAAAALPNLQYYAAYWSASDMVRYQLIWMQQEAGFRGTHLQVGRYNMEPTYLDQHWNFFYNQVFLFSQTTIQAGHEAGSHAYRGLGRIIQAMTLGLMTDTWGAVPYQYASQYFAGAFYPQYDTQEEIYPIIMQLLDHGIADLDTALTNPVLVPGPQQDLIYQGDLQKWQQAANVLKMRFMLRLANLTGDYESILTLAQSKPTFAGPQDDMMFYFDPALEIENPHYTHDTHIRNIRMGKYFVDQLKATNDPRLPVFVELNDQDEYVGSAPGEGLGTASFVGQALAAQHGELPLVTYTEQKFIEAELYLRNLMQSQADQAYEEAVKSSLAVHGVSDPQWEATYAEVENVTLEQIINAKYLALALQPEVWTDYRRTGFPQLEPYEGVEATAIPRRFVYPSNEVLANPDTPPNVTIYTRMWWDSQTEQ